MDRKLTTLTKYINNKSNKVSIIKIINNMKKDLILFLLTQNICKQFAKLCKIFASFFMLLIFVLAQYNACDYLLGQNKI